MFVKIICIVVLLTNCCSGLWATGGVYAHSITFKQIAALDGPAKFLGQQMGIGLKAAFYGVEVLGKKIDLIQADDAYEEKNAQEEMEKAVEDNDALAIVGSVGTPTAKAMYPIAENKKFPFIGAFSGSDILRGKHKYVFNLRASYIEEAEKLVNMAVAANKKKIGILMQRDAFGEAVLKGVCFGLSKHDLTIAGYGTFPRNTVDVEPGLDELLKLKPEVIVMVGPYKPVAEAIKKIRTLEKYTAIKDATIMTVSFVGTDALVNEIGSLGKGVVITQVVPNPSDPKMAIVREYQEAVEKVFNLEENKTVCGSKKFNWVSMEGYLVGRMVIEALKKVDPKHLNRESLMEALRKLDLDLGGFSINLESEKQGIQVIYNQASNYVMASSIFVENNLPVVKMINSLEEIQK